MTEGLQVNLCGSSAKVPLAPEDGLAALKSRVAGAFNLSAPFDLMGPEGRLKTDEDAAQAAMKEGELCVSTSEEALLDLERAREESGVLRWALLRQILGELRTQHAETAHKQAEGKHQAVLLEQQLSRERSMREAVQGALKNELVELKDAMALEVHKLRQESQKGLEETMATLQQQVRLLAEKQSEALEAKDAALKESLQVEAAGRQREADENLRKFQELRQLIHEESNLRSSALERQAAQLAQLEQRLTSETSAPKDLQAQHEAVFAKMGQEIQQLESKMATFVPSMQSSLADANAKIEAEQAARAAGVERLQSAVDSLNQEIKALPVLQERLSQVEASFTAQLSEATEASMARDQKLEDSLQQLTLQLEEETTDRKQSEQRAAGMLSSIQVAMGREQRAREAAYNEANRLLGVLETRLEGNEKSLQDLSALLKAEVAQLEETYSKFASQEQAAREALGKSLEQQQLKRHEALAEELRRNYAAQTEESRRWAQTLVERLSNDLRGEREALFQELNRRCDEVAKLNAEHIRLEMASEVQKVDAQTAELLAKQKAVLEEEKRHYEHQASVAAQEVKAALDAHGEFAEALEAEQRLIVSRLTEQLQREGAARHELMTRLGVMEMDVQKVKGHLPILFASPTAFR